MTKRKTTPKKNPRKKTRKKSRKNTVLNSSIVKAFAGLAILVIIVAIAGLLAHFLIPTEKPSKADQPSVTAPKTQNSRLKFPLTRSTHPKRSPWRNHRSKNRPET